MKNLVKYYFLILSPIFVIIYLSKNDLISSSLFIFLIFFYALIYRTYFDGKRLFDKGLITKKDIWKIIIPGKRFEYFGELYFKK